MVDFPDFYGGIARAAIPGYQRGIITMTAIAGGTLPPKTSDELVVGIVGTDEIWKLSRYKVVTFQNSLIEGYLYWGDLIIQRDLDYGKADIWFPDGLRYPPGTVLKIGVVNHADFSVDVYLNVAWVVEVII